MDVVLLGTGAADGWPNAFCRCASCRAQSAAGELRSPTSVLVDDVLLLDCGPETPRSALRAGRPLDRLEAVLLTHGHSDHSAPMALLSRSWAGRDEPLIVAGPAQVLEQWRPWVAPDASVEWRAVSAGDVVELPGHVVRVLAAEHEQPAVLHLVEARDGGSLLYATDTGALPDATVAGLVDHPVDLLLLEETFGDQADHGTGHHDLVTFGRELARLRSGGALPPDAEVVAIHLGHHNPPSPRLDDRLAVWGARPGRDGDALAVPRGGGWVRDLPTVHDHAEVHDHGELHDHGEARDHGGWGGGGRVRRTLVLGGARSGKSTAAERLLGAEPEVLYVATGPVPAGEDPAWAERVRRHRAQRAPGWTTLETDDAAAALRSATVPVLLDCLGTWLTGVLTSAGAWDETEGWEARAQERVDDLLDAWRDVRVPVVAVTNEVGSGVVPATVSGGLFRDWLGRLNQSAGSASERVLLVVAGRTLSL